MKPYALIARAALALPFAAVGAGAQTPSVAPEAADTQRPPSTAQALPLQFERLDADADRSLTLDEVPADSTLYRDFARWDANKDGVLNLPEFDRYADQIAQL